MKDLDSLPKLYVRGQIAPKDSFLATAGETFSASDLIAFLESHKEDPEIVVEISSDGGYRSEGVEIYSILKNCNKKVITVAYKANSIATVVMLGGSTRLIAETAPFTVHFARIDPANLGTESLTSDDFQRLADEADRADQQILNIYCNELGEERRTELLAAMAGETDLGARGAVKMGFATGYYKKKKKVVSEVEDYVGFALTDGIAKIIENKMEKTALQQLGDKIEASLKNISRRIAGIKNEITLTLMGGGGSVYAVPASADAPDELKGAKVYKVDDAGLPTDALVEDGELPLEDGRVLVVAGGVVTEVREAENLKEEVAAKEQEIADLKAQVQAKEAEIIALKGEKVEMGKAVDIIKNEFEQFKKQVPKDPAGKTDDDDEPKKVDLTKMSRSELFIHNRKEQIKAERKEKV